MHPQRFMKINIPNYLKIITSPIIALASVSYTHLSMYHGGDRTAVYVNVGAMASLAVAVGILNFKNPPKTRR